MKKENKGLHSSQGRLYAEITIGIALLLLQVVSILLETLINEKNLAEAFRTPSVWFPIFVSLYCVYCLIRIVYACNACKLHTLISTHRDPQVVSDREGLLPLIEHPKDVGFLISKNSHEHSTLVTTKKVFVVRGDASKMSFDIYSELRDLSGFLYVNDNDTEGCEILSEVPVFDLTVALGSWSPLTMCKRPDSDGRYLIQKEDKSFDIVEYRDGLFVKDEGQILNWMVTSLHPKSPLRNKDCGK